MAVSPFLNCQSYFIVETKAPNGYHTLEDAKTVTVIPGTLTDITTVEITNERGSLLPETGSIGTTIFTVTGSVLLLIAVALLLWRRQYIFNN